MEKGAGIQITCPRRHRSMMDRPPLKRKPRTTAPPWEGARTVIDNDASVSGRIEVMGFSGIKDHRPSADSSRVSSRARWKKKKCGKSGKVHRDEHQRNSDTVASFAVREKLERDSRSRRKIGRLIRRIPHHRRIEQRLGSRASINVTRSGSSSSNDSREKDYAISRKEGARVPEGLSHDAEHR